MNLVNEIIIGYGLAPLESLQIIDNVCIRCGGKGRLYTNQAFPSSSIPKVYQKECDLMLKNTWCKTCLTFEFPDPNK